MQLKQVFEEVKYLRKYQLIINIFKSIKELNEFRLFLMENQIDNLKKKLPQQTMKAVEPERFASKKLRAKLKVFFS